jgi:hypothetical protein
MKIIRSGYGSPLKYKSKFRIKQGIIEKFYILPLHLSENFVTLFPFCGKRKRKSEHKKFWKRIGGCRGKGKNLFQKVFPFPRRQGAALEQCRYSNQERI